MKFSLFALLALVSSVTAFASDDPMIEINASVDTRFDSPYTSGQEWQVIPSYTATVGGKLNLLLVEAEAEFTAHKEDTTNFEIRGSASVLILKLHEIYIRTGGTQGEEKRAALGLGGTFGLPMNLGKLSASVGAMGVLWQRPEGADQKMFGFYAGGTLYMHVWRFQNELRVAYYATPSFNFDPEQALTSGGKSVVSGWANGIIASDKLFFKAISLPLLTLGPELRAEVEQLPDGTEWLVTAGIGGTLGF
ncbi:hypothetical protein WDW86_06190 [Bdellovibrionota bacterium FG-2]